MCASRQSAVAGARQRACRALGGQERPDCRTMRALRPHPLEACTEVVVPVGRLAGAAGRVPWGQVATDGTPSQGQASRHQAMSDGSRHQAVERWREALEAVVTAADQQDDAADAALGSRRGDAWPAARARRAPRWATMEAARRRGEAPAKADAKAPRHCTAPERPRRRPTNQGWDDGGKAPARGDAACQRIVACDVTAAPNDQPQAEPRAQATRAPRAQAGLEGLKDESANAHAIPATCEHGEDSAAAGEARAP